MIKLFQIADSVNWGSVGKIANHIGDIVLSQGGESYIAYGRYYNPSKSCAIKIGSKCDLYYHILQTRLFDRHGLASQKATKALIRQIQQIQPDIIHLHQIHGYFLNYQILFDYLSSVNTPVVWTLHDSWAFTGHCTNPTTKLCNRYKTGCYNCPDLNAYPKAYTDNSKNNYILKKKAFTSVGKRLTLVPVSNWLEEIANQSYLKDVNIETIHNGIDLDAFSPLETYSVRDKYNLYKKRVLLGVAAPWSERKGLFDFHQLCKIMPESYCIILVGLTQAQIKQLPEGIIGIERTQNIAELAQLYSVADVFLNMTYEDNYPTVNLEAMACGTPVITYRTGGSPEAVTAETGRIVEQGDLQGLVQAIHDLESVNREELRNACRSQAEECFDKEKCFRQYIDLYNKLLKNK